MDVVASFPADADADADADAQADAQAAGKPCSQERVRSTTHRTAPQAGAVRRAAFGDHLPDVPLAKEPAVLVVVVAAVSGEPVRAMSGPLANDTDPSRTVGKVIAIAREGLEAWACRRPTAGNAELWLRIVALRPECRSALSRSIHLG